MSDDENKGQDGFLDQLVEWTASAMDAVGLSGRRLRWRWQAKRKEMAEASAQREVMLRSAKGKHKMCPACRTLVPRDAASCPDCGEALGRVSKPSTGRLITNMFPGLTATTSLIMLANGFWFVMLMMAWIKSGTSGGLGLMRAFDPELLVRFGSGLSHPFALSDGVVTGGEWWRYITPIFLHGSIIHIFFNSYFLLYLGPVVEDIWGTERYWVIYLLCGISGAGASIGWRHLTPNPRDFVNTVGASGAIMGLVGLLLIYGLRHRSTLGQSMKQLVTRLLIYSVIASLVFPIDHINHLGGFACGAFLGLVLPPTPFKSRAEATAWQLLAFAGVLLVLFAFYKVAMFQR